MVALYASNLSGNRKRHQLWSGRQSKLFLYIQSFTCAVKYRTTPRGPHHGDSPTAAQRPLPGCWQFVLEAQSRRRVVWSRTVPVRGRGGLLRRIAQSCRVYIRISGEWVRESPLGGATCARCHVPCPRAAIDSVVFCMVAGRPPARLASSRLTLKPFRGCIAIPIPVAVELGAHHIPCGSRRTSHHCSCRRATP